MAGYDRKVMTMWDIRESVLFTKQCTDLGLNIRRLDEVRVGIDWAVHTNAMQIEQAPDTDLRVLRTVSFPGIPALRIMIRIEDENVAVYEWIELADEDPDDPAD